MYTKDEAIATAVVATLEYGGDSVVIRYDDAPDGYHSVWQRSSYFAQNAHLAPHVVVAEIGKTVETTADKTTHTITVTEYRYAAPCPVCRGVLAGHTCCKEG